MILCVTKNRFYILLVMFLLSQGMVCGGKLAWGQTATGNEWQVQKGEQSLQGTVLSVHPANCSFVVKINSLTLYNGVAIPGNAGKVCTVEYNEESSLFIRGTATVVPRSGLKAKDSVMVLGMWNDRSACWVPRKIAVWNQEGEGGYQLVRNEASALEAAAPQVSHSKPENIVSAVQKVSVPTPMVASTPEDNDLAGILPPAPEQQAISSLAQVERDEQGYVLLSADCVTFPMENARRFPRSDATNIVLNNNNIGYYGGDKPMDGRIQVARPVTVPLPQETPSRASVPSGRIQDSESENDIEFNATDIAKRIAQIAVLRHRAGSAQAYRHRCQALVRTTVQQVMRHYDQYFKGSARTTMEAFRSAGIGRPYTRGMTLKPGDLLYTGQWGGKYGHAMLVGSNGRIIDNVGDGNAAIHERPIDWVVRPGAVHLKGR